MLSRVAASRVGALLRQTVIKPVVAGNVQYRNQSSVVVDVQRPDEFPVKFRDEKFPVIGEYKKIAGESSGVMLFGSAAAYLLAHEHFILTGAFGGHLCYSIILFTLAKAGQPYVKKYWVNKNRKRNEIMADIDTKRLQSSQAVLAEAEAVTAFLDDRPEYFDIMQNREELEAEILYRQRLLEVETELQKRLDYQLAMQSAERAIEEKHIAAWVEKEVLKSIAEQKDEDIFQTCLKSLEDMAAAKSSA